MTPSQQKLLDDFNSHPEFVTVEIMEVPEVLANQIEQTDIIMYRLGLLVNDKSIDMDLVLTNDYINSLDFDNISYSNLVLEGLVYCDKCGMDCSNPDVTITGYIHNFHENKGKPAYFIRPSDSFGIRLTSEYPAPLPDSPALRTLISRIEQIPDVASVTVERIVSQELKDMVNCPADEGLIFYVEDKDAHDWRASKFEENKTNAYWFVYPKHIWNNDITFDKAVEAIAESFVAHRTGQPYPGKK